MIPITPKTRAIALTALLIAPLIAKVIYINQSLNNLLNERFVGVAQILTNDAPIYAALASLIYLSLLKLPFHNVTNRALSLFLRLIAGFIFTIYTVDLIIIVNFNTHLTLNDTLKYASYALKYTQQGFSSPWQGIIGSLAFILVMTSLIRTQYQLSRRVNHIGFIVTIALTLTPSLFGTHGNQYVHTWMFSNIISYNLTILSENKPYSRELTDRVRTLPSPPQQCLTIAPSKPNIVLLMVESLSSHHSQLFSGLNNWTPKLDQLAKENTAFTNFFANGFTTEDAEISLLTGRLPLYPPSSYTDGGGTSFNGFYQSPQSLPKLLNQLGYQTDFLTSADLSFSNTGKWAKSLGFDHVEGHEHPSYNNWPRYHFKSVPDEALFNRLLSRIEETRDSPYLAFVKTVSTHHPYINPQNNKRSEQEAIQYADQQIANFYQALKRANFFTNGFLIIVGDHRSMTPLKVGEIETMGEMRAAARVPLILIKDQNTNKGSQEVTSHFQQTDIFNGLKGLITGQRCSSDWIGDIFAQRTAKYIYHRRGDNRNTVNIFTSEGDHSIVLDGDTTRIIGGNTGYESEIINQINRIRMNF